jgi:N-methylhydantoinase B/oxoprolinase/acetone carboxylase alpha subunit
VPPIGIDPVTFEVIRHRLWAINDDQGRMAARLSGSFIVFENFDFNAALVTADGRGLYCGVYILQHGATIDHFVRMVLDAWPAQEIRDGDMFFTNDPWWGALHANDGILAMPIFHEGELVLWSGIVMHDDDVGSPIPGSFVSGSHDRFGEAPLFPAIKLVEGFEPRADLERVYLRNSRTPEHNALNMRARVAALRSTHERIGELVAEYGVETFRAAQDEIVDYVERVVRRRLRAMPDGEWFAQGYHDHDGNVDELYRICTRVAKHGDRLTVDLTGTAEQAIGSINCARPAMEGAVMGVFLTLLCHDLPWAVGALRAIIEIVSEEGTINNAVSPAGASMASVMMTLSTQDVLAHAVAKMMLCAEGYRGESQASWTPGINGCLLIAPAAGGDDPYVGAIVDFVSGGGGARTFADGVDSGGIFHSMATQAPNVETIESRVPALAVYRRELCDSGGAGRFRGGVAVETATVPHKLPIAPAGLNTISSGVRLPAGRGLSGGLPGAAAANVILRDSNIRELLAAGTVPLSEHELDCARREVLPAKGFTAISEGDLLIGVHAGGGGYGDPLRRAPEQVVHDVGEGLVSPEQARAIYGVVVAGGDLDGEATARTRRRALAARLESARPWAPDADAGPETETSAALPGGTVLHPVSDTVEAVAVGDTRALRCTICHTRLGALAEDHKRTTRVQELALTAINPHNGGCREDVVARWYHCPGCGTALALDVQRRDEPPLPESTFADAPAGGGG